MATYFTGPNASDYLGYVEAENRRRAAQAATTNQLISDIARTAVARDRANNELTLGQGALANDRYGMDNRSAMLDRELANRTAMSNSANELAKYMHANASGSVMEQGKTARELETARSAADQERLEMQLAQQYQLSGDEQNTNLAVARMGAVASILPNFMAQAPDSRTWDAVMAENRSRSEAAQTANADLIKETGSILPSFLGGGDANAAGRTKHVADKGLTNRYDSAGLKFNATTGLYEAVPVPVPSRQGSPDAVNQLLRWGNMVPSGIGLPAQSAAPTPVAAPVGRDIGNGIKRFGPSSGFVPAQDNPVATTPAPVAPPQASPSAAAPSYGPNPGNEFYAQQFVNALRSTPNDGRNVWPTKGINYLAAELARRTVSPDAPVLRFRGSGISYSPTSQMENALLNRPNQLGLTGEDAWNYAVSLPQPELMSILSGAYNAAGIQGPNALR